MLVLGSIEGTHIKQKVKKGSGGKRNRINEEVEASEVRLINADGQQAGIVSIADAQAAATAAALDLVEISPDSEPPVCRLMDYGKHLFQEKKKRSEAKKKQKQSTVKEIKFRPSTEDGDYLVKLKNLTRFLESGDKAKVTLRFRGREMAFQQQGLDLMHRVAKDLEEFGTVEQEAKIEGRQMVMVLGPKKR